MIPTYLLAKMAKDKVTVALGGDGGDEVFAGYDRYSGIKLASTYGAVPSIIRNRVLGPLSARLPESTRKRDAIRKIKRFLAAPNNSVETQYASWMRHFTPSRLTSICTPEFLGTLGSIQEQDDVIIQAFEQALAQDSVSAAQWVDTMTYLPGDLMVKADRMTMAHGLELRSPFLDHRLIEFAATIPSNLKVRGLSKKYILKKAFAGLLPEKITKRPKEGFSIPLASWLRNELSELSHELLLNPSSHIASIVKSDEIERMLNEHARGDANHHTQLWNLLCLEAWAVESKINLG
jgi:asparagine synthase (glutamine-hydrolysing)